MYSLLTLHGCETLSLQPTEQQPPAHNLIDFVIKGSIYISVILVQITTKSEREADKIKVGKKPVEGETTATSFCESVVR